MQARQQLPGGIERENPLTQTQSGGIDVRAERTHGRMGAPKMEKAPKFEQQRASSLASNTNLYLHVHTAFVQVFVFNFFPTEI